MKTLASVLLVTLLSAAAGLRADDVSPAGKIAPKPLFRDPIYDGAADPVVIWNRAEKKWFMFYTNRRASQTNGVSGVEWVHGTKIGIAESSDGGATWTYRGTADIRHGGEGMTHWAPEVIEHDGLYHMYLTFVPGIFSNWGHPRDILHLTSTNLLNWKYESTLKLAADRVIDACVLRLSDGTWRMWYNNERDG
ncbi:MAG TPA: glycosyl hydrolase, partial [Verrucomicrobiota bacterium]|nr:glycosyl hydrolase [Verrucomicrobiota bacterium]